MLEELRGASRASEAAALLRALIDELAEAQLHAQGLDPDLTMLGSSPDQLISLGDYAPMLASAGQDLKNLPDTASADSQERSRSASHSEDQKGRFPKRKAAFELVGDTGIEPVTSSV
ncbi:hypothetical protein [Nonomuraea dietziae]|uniref:hypothetical protein n=1 Tax=Nonomuraea dietziae TaxID=65515 RepID=UPI0033FDF764